MACPVVTTGDGFLLGVLEHVDCQAQVLGSYGFQSLAQPGGIGAAVLASAAAILIALLGFRLILGRTIDGHDLVGTALRIGIVITLAASWPAVRTLAYDTVLKGPAQVAGAIADPGTLPAASAGLAARLQGMDDAILALTVGGTGRVTGVPGFAPGQDFREAVLDDASTMGWARVTWLAGTLAPLVALRLAAGFLLAITPLLALGLLFEATRGLFAGWVRGLVLCMFGSAMLAMVHAVQLAILEPWAASALQLRGANYATPAVPTELMALNLAFAIAANLSLAIIARVAFQRGWISVSAFYTRGDANRQQEVREPMAFLRASPDISRADYLALSINRMEQRQGCTDIGRIPQAVDRHASGDGDGNAGSNHSQPLGETYRHSARRADRRSTLAGQRRDSNE